MTDSTYTARLIDDDNADKNAETIELAFINGLPQKAIVRPMDELGLDQVWELVSDSDDFEYRRAGVPGADYS